MLGAQLTDLDVADVGQEQTQDVGLVAPGPWCDPLGSPVVVEGLDGVTQQHRRPPCTTGGRGMGTSCIGTRSHHTTRHAGSSAQSHRLEDLVDVLARQLPVGPLHRPELLTDREPRDRGFVGIEISSGVRSPGAPCLHEGSS